MKAAKSTYFILLGVIVLSFVALGASIYLASGILQGKSQEVSKAKLQSRVVEERQAMLRKARADIEKYDDLSKVAKSIVPQDKDQAQTIREITNLAAQNNILLGSVTFPASSLGDGKSPLTQLTPVTNIPGVYTLPITVASDAKTSAAFASFINFLDTLEHNRRTALVTSISLQPDTKKPGYLFFTLTLEEYIKP